MEHGWHSFVTRTIVSRLLTGYKSWTNPDLEVPSSAGDMRVTNLVATMIMVLIIQELAKIITKYRDRRRVENESDEERQRHRENLINRIVGVLREDVHECPICLGDANFPVMTDCGHVFCCSCVIRYWKQSKTIFDPCDCAYCRYTFNKLHPIQWPIPGTSDEIDDQLQKSQVELDDYNRRFSTEQSPLDTIRDIPVAILNHIKHYFRDNFGWISLIRLVIVPVCAITTACLYVGTLPDDTYYILLLFDDLFVTILLVIDVTRRLRDHLNQRGNSPIFIIGSIIFAVSVFLFAVCAAVFF